MNILDTNQNDQPQIDPNLDPLEVLTGPGGKFDRSKYASEADMYKAIAKGKVEGDAYIDHMLKRHDELREDYKRVTEAYNAGPKLQELIDRFAQGQQSQNANTQIVAEDKSEFDLSQIEKLVEAKLQAGKQQDKEDANAQLVEDRLIEQYGPNYKSMLKQQVDQLGLSAEFVNDLARKHPQVLFKTLGLDGRRGETFQAPAASSHRAEAFSPSAQKRTWAYYQKIRKDNPTLYRDPKTQNQMFKDAVELGKAFEDGDWNSFGHL